MEQWCDWFVYLVTVVPQVGLFVISRWFDQMEWWRGLPGDRKVEMWVLLSAVLGVALGVGVWLSACTQWEGWAAWLYGLAQTLVAYFGNKAAHQVWKAGA